VQSEPLGGHFVHLKIKKIKKRRKTEKKKKENCFFLTPINEIRDFPAFVSCV